MATVTLLSKEHAHKRLCSSQNGKNIKFARVLQTTLPPTKQCKVVKLTPLRSVHHPNVLDKRDLACRFGSRMFGFSIPMWCVVLRFVLHSGEGILRHRLPHHFELTTDEAAYDE